MIQPLVTVSIPLFKCEDFLEKCLESVGAQSYTNLEVTLINDQTPDKSVEIAQNFIEKYQLKNWKIYHLDENSGLSVVRNKGIDTANGKYIFFLDSDDTITKNCIEILVEKAEKNEFQVVVGNTETYNLETKSYSDAFLTRTKKEMIIGNQQIFESFVHDEYSSSSWNKLIRIDFLKENKLYFTPGLFAQDSLQSFQTALKLENIGFVHQKTYTYFLHKNSVIHNRNKNNFDNWFTIGNYINEAFKTEKNPARRILILKYLTDYKKNTLLMNWKAQHDEVLWKESYRNYKKLSALKLKDYLSPNFSNSTKKSDFFNRLPTFIGFKLFKWRYER